MDNGQVITQAAFDSSFGVGVTGAVVGAGKMSPEAADRFIDYLFDVTSLKRGARIERMTSPQKRISILGLGKRILRPGTSGTSPGVTAQLTPTEVLLTAQEMVALAKINDDELEDNIEGRDLTDHFMQMIARQVGNELEAAFLMGQRTAPTAPAQVEGQIDGWLYQVQQHGHVIDGSALGDGASGANTRYFTPQKLSKAFKAIPSKYKTQAIDFRHFVSPGYYQDFIDTLANRATPLGDIAFGVNGVDNQNSPNGYEHNLPEGNRSRLGYAGPPMHTVPLLPENLFVAKASPASTTIASGGVAGTDTATLASASGFSIGDGVLIGSGATAERGLITGLSGAAATIEVLNTADGNFAYGHNGDAVTNGTVDGTFSLTTHPDNLVVGIVRDVRAEPTRWGPERATYLTVSLRVDAQMVNPDAAALVEKLAIK